VKILLINDIDTPAGGAELQLLMLRDGLRARGHDVRSFASRAGFGLKESFADYQCFGTHSRLQVLSSAVNPSAYWQLRRALAKFKPDVVHVSMLMWQLSPLILPLLRGIPSVYHIVYYKPICPIGTKLLPNGERCNVQAGVACYQNKCVTLQSWLPLMTQRALWQKWYKVFSAIVANGSVLQKRLVEEGIRVDHVIHGAVPFRPPRPPLSNPPVVGFVGRLVREKGADILIKAFAQVLQQVPHAKLLIVGDGPEKERLSQTIRDLALTAPVEMLGHLSRPEMESRLSAAWVQVIPSLWDEPFGLVTIDAMMRGTAVVASAAGELANTVVHGETGLLVKPGDVDGLAKALITLLKDREQAERMGEAGRHVALAHYSEDAFVNNFLDVYGSIRQGVTHA
jgi:glycosyltransferase involved in cell wall biosynthesis